MAEDMEKTVVETAKSEASATTEMPVATEVSVTETPAPKAGSALPAEEESEETTATLDEALPTAKKAAASEPDAAALQAKKEKQQLIWRKWLAPVVALVVVCLLISSLLGITNAFTAPIIAANAQAAAEQARTKLLPSADGFTAVELNESYKDITAFYKATNGAGYVVEATARGYGGAVPVMVAFDANGTITGVSFPENNETVGLGQKIRLPEFTAQFTGLPAQALTTADIDGITSATISTGAAVSGINAAVQAFNQYTGGMGSVADLDEEAVREYLLPGEALTPIALDAPDVQPIAWRSSEGHYIIYGEQPGSHDGSLIIAAVAMDENGTILNLWLNTSGENESYGALLDDNLTFMQSFIGHTNTEDVAAVAGISGSSASVKEAVEHALAALSLAKEAA